MPFSYVLRPQLTQAEAVTQWQLQKVVCTPPKQHVSIKGHTAGSYIPESGRFHSKKTQRQDSSPGLKRQPRALQSLAYSSEPRPCITFLTVGELKSADFSLKFKAIWENPLFQE